MLRLRIDTLNYTVGVHDTTTIANIEDFGVESAPGKIPAQFLANI